MVNPRSRFTCSMVELSQTALNAFLIPLAYLCGEMWRQCGGEYWDSRDGQRRWWSFGLGKICHRYNHVEKRLLDHGYKCFPHTACGCQDTHQVTMWCKVCFTWCLRSQVRFTRAHDKELSLSFFFWLLLYIFLDVAVLSYIPWQPTSLQEIILECQNIQRKQFPLSSIHDRICLMV